MRQLFRVFPGMEYCDLKHDHVTGLSKVSESSARPNKGRDIEICNKPACHNQHTNESRDISLCLNL